MNFFGIDLGWEGKPSGLAHLYWDSADLCFVDWTRAATVEEILTWLAQRSGSSPALVAVDAPLVVTNESGMRQAEKLVSRIYGRSHACCHASNLGRSFVRQTTALERHLRKLNFQHGADIQPRFLGRYQIEVYPHPAIVELFRLDRIIKYKKGSVSQRKPELARYRDLILSVLPGLEPRLHLEKLPEVPSSGKEMRDLEDRLDALMCAFIGAYWWYWGTARNKVFGSAAGGYIVVPMRDLSAGPSASPQ